MIVVVFVFNQTKSIAKIKFDNALDLYDDPVELGFCHPPKVADNLMLVVTLGEM